jgi:hypothetical protein
MVPDHLENLQRKYLEHARKPILKARLEADETGKERIAVNRGW